MDGNVRRLRNIIGQPQRLDGVTGSHNNSGGVYLCWDTNMHKLVSPDGQKHALPCDWCGNVYWHDRDVVNFICGECVSSHAYEHGVAATNDRR